MADAPGHLQIPKPQVVRPTAPAAAPSALVVGAVDDPAEHEADRMADAVLGSLRRSPIAYIRRGPTSTRIARASAATLDEDIDPDDLDPENGTAEFAGPDTNDAPHPTLSRRARSIGLPPHRRRSSARRVARSMPTPARRIRRSSGRPLDPTVRGEMESGFGTDSAPCASTPAARPSSSTVRCRPRRSPPAATSSSAPVRRAARRTPGVTCWPTSWPTSSSRPRRGRSPAGRASCAASSIRQWSHRTPTCATTASGERPRDRRSRRARRSWSTRRLRRPSRSWARRRRGTRRSTPGRTTGGRGSAPSAVATSVRRASARPPAI